MNHVKMDDKDEQLRAKLLESILEYIEGMRTFRSILTFGITAHSKSISPRNPNLMEVVSQLNSMGQQVVAGRNFSKEEIKETFTTMLEKLTKD
jgi:predicted house-cleaning noncanonical NTP pyrophosphatase (MazG superfamily)